MFEKMNRFQEEVLKEFEQFTENDFKYFTDDSEKKVQNLGLPKETCSISKTFEDAVDPLYHRTSYCFKNCGFKCLRGKNES